MIREFSQSLDIISALENEPNDEGGLSATELKAKFDEGGNAIKDYINGSLIPDISDEISEEINAVVIAAGNVPKGGLQGQMLVKKTNADYDLQYADVPSKPDALKTARTVLTNLASTAAANFDGTENITPGVSGVLRAENGGTGAGNALGAALALGRGFGSCTTAAATAAKVVTLSGFARLKGAVVGVTFTNANTASSPTLNVNGTGSAAVINAFTGTAASALDMSGASHTFQYDGTSWQLLNPKSIIVAGYYSGNNVTTRFISLGFTPRAVLLMTTYGVMGTTSTIQWGGFAVTGSKSENAITIVENGFNIFYSGTTNGVKQTNTSTVVYNYIAFA